MSRIVVLLLATVALAGGGLQASAAPPAGPAPQMVGVIVTLKEQADVKALKEKKRAARIEKVVKALRAKADATQKELRKFLDRARAQGQVGDVRPYWVFNGLAVTATPEFVEVLARRPEVEKITPDVTIDAPAGAAATGPPETNVALVRAPELWARGYTGEGIVVASMDTGVDATHPDLAPSWRGGTNSWFDPSGEHPTTPTDRSGHGTWTMGVMVGRDAGGTAIGVAPDARWIAVKIFNDAGSATVSRIHEGFQWLLDPDGNPATADTPDVVNNSWTFSGSGCNLEFQLDLVSLRAAGILPVFAAGNSGPFGSSSRSPANNPEALAVGATDDFDRVYSYSARGPSSCASSDTTYPELVAPGVSIRTSDLFGRWRNATGTSLAAPHVAGALALLLDANSDLEADLQEAALEASAIDLGLSGSDTTFGHGRLDIVAADEWLGTQSADFALTASPASVSTTAGGPATYVVGATPSGGFSGDVSLSLTGLPAGATAAFTPALVSGGSGSADLTVTTAGTTPPGNYPLTITGTSGALSHTATVALVVTSAADFTLTASPASATVPAGGSAAYLVTVTRSGSFSSDVSLALTGLPAGATASFTPAVIGGGSGSSDLTVTTTGTTPPGSYPLTITGTGGALSRTASATLVVTPAPDFTVTASPASASTTAGGSVGYTVTVTPSGGFAGDVSLVLAGLPAGATASFTPAVIGGGSGSSDLTLTTAATTTPGNYALTITGTSATLARSAEVNLAIVTTATSAAPDSATILSGSLWGGTAANLAADDTLFYEVAATATFTRTTSWRGNFLAVPNSLTGLKITYKGKNSRTCTQTVAAWQWATSTWVQLDSRSVGATEVMIPDLAPPGAPADYVSGTAGDGEVRIRVRCTTAAGAFVAGGNLLRVAYTRG